MSQQGARFMNQLINKSFERGQSLLEITLTLGIAALVISAIAITTIIGLQNSEYSQNQIQATKLAQEGLEAIRSMRDNDTPVTYLINPYCWNDSDTNKVWTLSTGTYYLRLSSTPGSACSGYSALSDSPSEPKIQGKFNRTVLMEPAFIAAGQYQIKFTVTVSWVDSSGTHQSALATILTNYKD